VPYTSEGEDGLMYLPVSGSTEENFANMLICGIRTSEFHILNQFPLEEDGVWGSIVKRLTVEEKEAIVHCIVAEFGTDVPYMNTLEGLMGFQISDLTHERVWAIGLSSND
jgi:hypothetical protein